MTAIYERVAKGAALLDEKKPGWERKIDLADLELSHNCRCVLGQLYTDYDIGRDVLWGEGNGPCSASGYPYGFDATFDAALETDSVSDQYRALDEAWISLIKERFDVGALSDQ